MAVQALHCIGDGQAMRTLARLATKDQGSLRIRQHAMYAVKDVKQTLRQDRRDQRIAERLVRKQQKADRIAYETARLEMLLGSNQ